MDGKANLAVVNLLSELLGVAPSRVRIVRGIASRDKLVEAEPVDDKELLSRLQAIERKGGD